MGLQRMAAPRRVLAALSGLLLVAGVLALLTPTVARADTRPLYPANPTTPATVASDRLPTVQINGVVWSQTIVGNKVYAAGKFTSARPAGSAAGVNETPRNNLLAYDLTTGALDTGFAPDLNAQAVVVTGSPDGSRIYVGGDFTLANGQTRNRIAAYDTATGALISTFKPSFTGQVHAIAATNTKVYVGGSISAAGGQARDRLAAVNAADGSLLPWNPIPGVGPTTGNRDGNTATSKDVMAMVVSPDGSKVVAAGHFYTMNGTLAVGVSAIDAVSGATLPFAINQLITNQGINSAVYSLSSDGTNVYGSGYDFNGPGNLEGSFAARWSDGAVVHINDCHGDTYSTYPTDGVVYLVGHPHDCSNIGSYPEQTPRVSMRALALSLAPAGVVGKATLRNTAFQGKPAPSVLPWFPSLAAGTFTGQSQAAWNVTGNGQYLVLGGEFIRVNGTLQQGLVRMAVPSIAPNKRPPSATGLVAPTVSALSAGTVRVTWQATNDDDNENLTYKIFRDAGTTPVGQFTAASQWWRKPTIGFTDLGVPAGSHTYRVTATDPFNNVAKYPTSAAVDVTAGPAVRAYSKAVLGNGPEGYWPLGESSGTTAGDLARNADMTVGSTVTRGQPGAIAGDTDTAFGFPGNSTGFLATQTANPAPLAFAEEAWFKAGSATTTGKIMGFGNAKTGNSTTYDRHVYLDSTGRLTFGVASGVPTAVRNTIQSTANVRDGRWHHVVASLSPSAGMALYLDGQLVGTKAGVTPAINYTGYWRVGGDASWSGSAYFNGVIDEAAVYPAPLTAANVTAHYNAGGGDPGTTNAPPVAGFTHTESGLTATFTNTSTDPENGALTYSWDFGDGTTSTDASPPPHTYATAGDKTVVLTATDPGGLSNTATQTVTVTAGGAATWPGTGAVAADRFERTTTSGWGTAELGGAWTVPAASSSVSGGAGHLDIATAGTGVIALQNGVSVRDVAVQGDVSMDQAPTGGGTYVTFTARRISNNQYRTVVKFLSNGQVTLNLTRLVGGVETTLRTVTLTGVTYTPGAVLRVRFDVSGNGTTTLQAKAWLTTGAEPADWQNTITDTTAALQAPGAVGTVAFVSGSATTVPFRVNMDNWWAGASGSVPPAP